MGAGFNTNASDCNRQSGSQDQEQSQARFLEGNANVIGLPEEDVGEIEELLEFAHSDKLQNFDSSKADAKSAIEFTKKLVQMFIVAERWDSQELGKLAINGLLLHYKTWHARWWDAARLNVRGLGGSHMRRMVMQQMVSNIRQVGWDTYPEGQLDGGSAFIGMIRSGEQEVVDLVKMLLETKDVPNPSCDANPCQWHRHDNTRRDVAGTESGGEPSTKKRKLGE